MNETRRRARARAGTRSAAVAAAWLLVLAAPEEARAQDFWFRSTTLLSTRPDLRDGELGTTFPMYELLTLRAGGIRSKSIDDLSVTLSAWGALDPGKSGAEGVGNRGFLGGDLSLFYAEAKLMKRRLSLRLGRHFAMGGVVRPMQIDGASLTFLGPGGLGVSAFGGLPVESEFAAEVGDVAYGARLFYRHSINAEAGASFIHVLDAGRLARMDVGLDGRWVPHRMVTLSAYGAFAVTELRFAELNAAVSVRPWRYLQVSVAYMRTAPDLLLPRTSIFSVFALDRRDEVGLSVTVSAFGRLRLYGDYYLVLQGEGDGEDLDLEEGGAGHRGGGKATLTLGRNVSPTTLGLESRVLDVASNGYVELRAFAIQRFAPGPFLTADVAAYRFREPIHDEELSFTASAGAGWDLDLGLRVMFVATGGMSPFFERRWETMLNVVYSHLFAKRKAAP